MKKLFIVLCVALLMGCATTTGDNIINPPCTLCTDVMPGEKSLICERLPNPCTGFRLLSVAGQAGVVWEAYTADQAKAFMVNQVRPAVLKGTTYDGLQVLLLQQISKFNTKLGGTFLILSSEVLIFPDVQIMYPKDQKIALMEIDKFIAKMDLLGATIKTMKGPGKVTGVDAKKIVGD